MKLPSVPKRPNEFYHLLPKVDLHRHLEGSLRFETVRELARTHGMDLPPTGQLRTMVQIQEDEPLTFENFLSKFSTLRLFYRSPEVIYRITQEAIADAAADNVRYLELRFTPFALSKAQGFSLGEVMDWVIEATRQAEKTYGVMTRLIASINRHESPSLAEQVVQLALVRKNAGIVGLDLAGDEAGHSAEAFIGVFREAKEKGLYTTVHAGEWNTGENVAQAIELFGADRIGHGVRVLESPHALQLARQNNIPFEVCITSNYQSGVVPVVKAHPIMEMISAGLNVTLNSDDPSISQITLSDEYRLICEVFGASLEELHRRVLNAAQAAFLPDEEKQQLKQKLAAEFPQEKIDNLG